jgi:dihydroorotate dehydrogenase electron transfer subunit
MAARRQTARVAAVQALGPGLGRIDLEAEGLAQGVAPGRFAMVGAPGRPDCILLRPYSYFLGEGTDRISLLVKNVGKGTEGLLGTQKGEPITVLGPLGSIFPPAPKGLTWAVAGGVGAAPFGGIEHRDDVRILLGARTRAEAGFADALSEVGARVDLATDDGSAGFHGNVVQLMRARLAQNERPQTIMTCGPSRMMAIVADVAREHGITCYASLEERMGCGIGVCRGCAHRDATGGWRCICVDGPVYNAADIFTEHAP